MKIALSPAAIHCPAPLKSQYPHHICIINTAGGRNDESLLEPLCLFFPIHLFLAHFWRVSPAPLCLNYLSMPSWDAIIQTLIPCNFHTSVCTLTCLMFSITYRAASPTLRIRDTGAQTVGWRKEGFTLLRSYTLCGAAVHFHIIISYMRLLLHDWVWSYLHAYRSRLKIYQGTGDRPSHHMNYQLIMITAGQTDNLAMLSLQLGNFTSKWRYWCELTRKPNLSNQIQEFAPWKDTVWDLIYNQHTEMVLK